MASVNKVILVGNVGKDPEVRYTADGTAISNLSLATSYRFKKDGEQKEETEWHRVSFFGRLAEIVSEYIKKGSSIYVEGRLRTRKWQDKDGQDRYTTEIVAENMQMLGGRRDGDGGEAQPSEQKSVKPRVVPESARPMDDFEDDIPFDSGH